MLPNEIKNISFPLRFQISHLAFDFNSKVPSTLIRCYFQRFGPSHDFA